jgi:hypothetical protein
LKLIICGDINIDYLIDNDRKRQLDAVLLSYNLKATVHFSTRVLNQSNTAIDNILTDNYKFTKYTVSPIYNGLSDWLIYVYLFVCIIVHICVLYGLVLIQIICIYNNCKKITC